MQGSNLRRNFDEEFRSSNLELFFDLVYVFAVTYSVPGMKRWRLPTGR